MKTTRNSIIQAADELTRQELTSDPTVEEKLELPIWQPPQNGLPRFFAGSFNVGDGITVDSLVPENKPGNDTGKVLEIIPISANEAFVRYTENPVAQKMAFYDVYLYLSPDNVKSSNIYDHHKHTHISTLEPGRLVRQGDKWQMVEKVQVRYDALSPEQVQTQVASVSLPDTPGLQPVTEEPSALAGQAVVEKLAEVNLHEQPAVGEKAVVKAPDRQAVVKQPDLSLDQPAPATQLSRATESVMDQAAATIKALPDAIHLTLLSEEQAKQEGIKESFYVLLLPEEYEELRQYLNNDGFLANEEINAALRDGRLTKEELDQKLAGFKLPDENQPLPTKMADYLWELHEILQDPTLEEVRANRLYRVETIQPIPNAGRKEGEIQPDEMGDKADKTIDIVPGGLLTNFLHNYKKAANLNATPPIQMDKKTRYQWQDVEASLKKMGLTREMLAESGNLDRLLKGEKTALIDFKSEFNGQETTLRGKIYLVKQGQEIKPFFQTQKLTLQVPEHYLGYTFSPEDKEILKQKGELGKQVELEDKFTRKKFNAYVGVDQETNSLSVWRAERVFIPMQIKGVDVSKEQQETLRKGGAIRLTGLTSENGQKFDADVFVSAGKRKLGFSPPSEAIKQSIDVKTAKDLGRSSNQLQGTSVGGSTTKENQPAQKQKKMEALQKGVAPDDTLKGQPGEKKRPEKSRDKNKKAQKDQGQSV